MKKLKFLSLSDEFKLADYDRLEREKNVKAQMLNNLEDARHRAKFGNDRLINRSEHLTEYVDPKGQHVREYSFHEKTIIEQPRAEPSESLVQYAKEQSLGMWLDESPFFAEMKKARTGHASW